ncbi:hypothetical protein QJQ45_026259 [Haematococcus lacustris]|nr:hypothetical protein QJQ45_026259 [Haematococcus lacustris]
MVAKESKDRASLERTKVVVRHLPAGLTQDGFVKTISKFVDPDRYNWLAYYPGKVSIKSTVLSRAYLNFVDPHSVYEFKAKFDGHLFVSNKGNQYRCSVEYAPFQKVPLPSKRNPLENTIHQDPDYQQFAQQLQDGPALLPSAAAQRESQERAAAMAGTPPDGPPTNALLEYLKAKYQSNPAMKLGGVRRRARPDQDDQVGKPGTVITGPNSRPTSKGASSKAQTAATTAATAATAAVKGSSRGGRDPAGDSKAGPPASSSSSSKEPAGPATITSTVQARTPSTPSTHAPKVIMSRAGHLSSASTGPNATATAIAAAAATAAATGRPSSAVPSVLARGAAPSQPAPATAPAPGRPPPSSGPAGGSQRGPGAARAPTSGLGAARDSSKGPATAAAATTVATASGSASMAAPAPLQRSLASARAPVTLAARSTGNGVNAASSALVRAGSGSDATQPTTANGAGAAAAAASAALVGGSAEGEGAPGPKRKVRMGFQAYKPPIRSHELEGG